MQERHNFIANTLDLCLSCTNPSIWDVVDVVVCLLHYSADLHPYSKHKGFNDSHKAYWGHNYYHKLAM